MISNQIHRITHIEAVRVDIRLVLAFRPNGPLRVDFKKMVAWVRSTLEASQSIHISRRNNVKS
jgi:hypothetical protein